MTSEPEKELEWRRRQAETFVQEPEDAEHYHGSHWEPFFEDMTEFMKRLPGMMEKALLMPTFGDHQTYQPPYPPPAEWPVAAYLSWPQRELGLMAAVKRGDDAHTMESFYPFVGPGTEQPVTIDRVHVWEGGVEAQIEATLGDAAICFFDPLFAPNRRWYLAGDGYQFILAGIAYGCRPAEDRVISLNFPPELQAKLREEAEKEGRTPPPDPPVAHTKGLAALIPIDKWDRDEYQFHGPVKAVEEIDMMGQAAWKVRATILRNLDDERDIDLDIVVTQRTWDGEGPPQVGQDIEGILWLQGYLWAPQRWLGSEKPE